MRGMDPAALDRYITGNYGEDQFADDGEWEPSALERQQEGDAALYEVESDIRERQEALDPRSDEWFDLQVRLRSVVRRRRGLGPV